MTISMKYSKHFFLIGSSLLLLWIVGGFNPGLHWEARLLKMIVVGLLAVIAWTLKNSARYKSRKSSFFILILLALAVLYAEPYASHLLFGHHHHHFFCLK